ncbi:MAG: excinuclease ABC subunit UvrA, partial [Rikenellaceae bacterium]
MNKNDKIEVIGARVHNLKNIDVEIPRHALTVITGLSGSGKSSLAFDTIHAEGQRRYMETLSAYARQFVGSMERPDVDKITGLSPVIAIEQKTTNKNPRSTVGTVTEINDFLRLLFARASTAYSYNTGEKMVKYSNSDIIKLIRGGFEGKKVAFLAPIVRGRKGHYRELFETLMKKGFIYACIDDKIVEMEVGMKLDRYKIHNIELVVDRVKIDFTGDEQEDALVTQRLGKTLDETMRQGKGTTIIYDYETQEKRYFSRNLMCPTTGIAYDEPAPHSFSFNTPKGACHACNGLGTEAAVDIDKIVPDRTLSINAGAIEPLGKAKRTLNFVLLGVLGKIYDFTLDDPFDTLSEDAVSAVINGVSQPLRIVATEVGMTGGGIHLIPWNGIIGVIEKEIEDADNRKGEKWREQFITYRPCTECGGSRLRKEALYFKIDDKNISDVSRMSIDELAVWVTTVESKLARKQQFIAKDILKEISERLSFLLDVGLGYLSLSRAS